MSKACIRLSMELWRRLYQISSLAVIALSVEVHSSSTTLTGEEIARRMETAARQRENIGVSYSCDRTYDLDYKGFPSSKHAQVQVHVERDGSLLSFKVTSESGSAVLRNHVLHKMVEAERDASTGRAHEESRLTLRNYSFILERTEDSPSGILYVLRIEPHLKSKLAWKGRVWVTSTDYSVIRAEGQPDKMPSWWTVHSDFTATYQSLRGLWIPERNVSDTTVRFGGHAHLVIENANCKLMTNSDLNRSAEAK